MVHVSIKSRLEWQRLGNTVGQVPLAVTSSGRHQAAEETFATKYESEEVPPGTSEDLASTWIAIASGGRARDMVALSEIGTDFKQWFRDMGTLPPGTQLWARLYPFPQLLFGLISAVVIGPVSLGAWYLYVRAFSFLVASRVHKWSPFTKLMGPIMHAPFLVLVPISVGWLLPGPPGEDEGGMLEQIHYYFIAYTTAITCISLLLDTTVLALFLSGNGVGAYKNLKTNSTVRVKEE